MLPPIFKWTSRDSFVSPFISCVEDNPKDKRLRELISPLTPDARSHTHTHTGSDGVESCHGQSTLSLGFAQGTVVWLWLSKPFWDPILRWVNSPPILGFALVGIRGGRFRSWGGSRRFRGCLVQARCKAGWSGQAKCKFQGMFLLTSDTLQFSIHVKESRAAWHAVLKGL